MIKKYVSPVRLVAAGAALMLAVAGCGGSSGGSAGGAEDKEVTFGVIQGWTDETSTTALLGAILKDNGYTVKTTEVSDNAPMYTGLSKGDIDVLSSSWLERTHKTYWEKYGKDIDDLGVYYDDAKLFLAVPTDSDMNSIEDLSGHAADLQDRIVGIEPGAGLTKTTKDDVMPAYGLDSNFKLVTSSTTAMLTELKKATTAKQPIVVTLWKPFWANQAFPVKALEDPKGAFGEPEGLHVVANKEYAAANPKVAAMLSKFKLTDEQYGSLEDTVVNKFPKGQEEEAARAWLKANPGFADQLAASLKS